MWIRFVSLALKCFKAKETKTQYAFTARQTPVNVPNTWPPRTIQTSYLEVQNLNFLVHLLLKSLRKLSHSTTFLFKFFLLQNAEKLLYFRRGFSNFFNKILVLTIHLVMQSFPSSKPWYASCLSSVSIPQNALNRTSSCEGVVWNDANSKIWHEYG